MNNILNSPVFTNLVTPICTSLVFPALIAVVGYLFVRSQLQKISVYQRLSSYGFITISPKWQTEREVRQMCERAEEIKILNVSGIHYYRNFADLLKRAMERGVRIYALVADPDSDFLTDIEEMEKDTLFNNRPVRDRDSFIGPEIQQLVEEYRDTPLNIRFYRSEYRLPFVFAKYADGSVRTWLTVTLPPLRSEQAMVLRGEKSGGARQKRLSLPERLRRALAPAKDSLVLRGKREKDYISDTSLDFIDLIEASFDTIWEHSAGSDKKVEELRRRNQEDAEN